jgi:hypothetical protein
MILLPEAVQILPRALRATLAIVTRPRVSPVAFPEK